MATARFTAVLAAATALAAAHDSATPSPPNILFFITDDQDWLLGSLDVMPNVRREIFEAGMTFNNSMVASPICCPSRTSLFSGRMPHNLGDDSLGWCGNFSSVREDVFTTAIAQRAKPATQQYTIGQIGKWYNEEGSFCKPGYVPAWHRGAGTHDLFHVMCKEVTYYNMSYNVDGHIIQSGDRPEDYLTAALGNATMQWLANVTAGPSPAPWLGYIALHAPHLPATPAPWYLDAPVPGSGAPRTPNFNVGWGGKHWAVDNGIDKPMSEAIINGTDTLWASRLRTLMSVDDLVGEALALLERTGQLNNTYIFYTSDHGYHLGQWGVWAEKANPYETDARVPLAVRGPGIPAGAVSTALVTNIDLSPTMMELAGVPNQWPSGPGKRDGTSIVPLLHPGHAELVTRTPAVADDSGAAAGAAADAVDAYSPQTSPLVYGPPSGWRDRLLIEFVGWENTQWLEPCQYALAPSADCNMANPPAGLTNAASNRYSALRVINATANTLYTEYRPAGTPLAPANTNWTEAYDVDADPHQMINAAEGSGPGSFPPAQLAAMQRELWAVARCSGASCP